MSYYPKNTKEIRIKQDDDLFGNSLKIKLTGGHTWVFMAAMMLIVAELLDIHGDLIKSNKLKEEENQIRMEQLDLARRQFQMDSIATVKNQKNR